jgi:hypothetical protein
VTAAQLRDLLVLEAADVRRLVLALRQVVLRTVPGAAEAVKFRCLCYYEPQAWFGSIGGNICMIEAKRGRVELSFIRGVGLPDPAGLLRGNGKFKRRVPVGSAAEARDPRLARLVRAAAKIAASDDFGE